MQENKVEMKLEYEGSSSLGEVKPSSIVAEESKSHDSNDMRSQQKNEVWVKFMNSLAGTYTFMLDEGATGKDLRLAVALKLSCSQPHNIILIFAGRRIEDSEIIDTGFYNKEGAIQCVVK